MATSSGSEGTTLPLHDETTPSKCHQIYPTPIPQPDVTPRPLSPSHTLSSGTSTPLPIEVIPELAIPSHAQLQWLNCPGGARSTTAN